MPLHPSLNDDLLGRLASQLRAAEAGGLTYWTEHGISADTLEKYGIGWDTQQGVYTIPYRSRSGALVGVHALNPRGREPPGGTGTSGPRKWLWAKGSKPCLWLIDSLAEKQAVVLCEGESDTLALRQCGCNAVGLPGVGQLTEAFARQLVEAAYGSPIYLALDEDHPGRAAAARYSRMLSGLGGHPRVLRQPREDSDVCDWLKTEGLESFREALAAAQELTPAFQLLDMTEAPVPELSLTDALPEGGFIRRFYDWARPAIAAPHEFLIYSALAVLSAINARRVVVQHGSNPEGLGMHTNTYMILVGKSGASYKTSAMRYTTALLKQVKETIHPLRRWRDKHAKWESEEESAEVTYLHEHDQSVEAFAEDVACDGRCHDFGIVCYYEWTDAVALGARRHMGGWKGLLTQLYDVPSGPWKSTKGAGRYQMARPTISILAGVQPTFLRENLENSDLWSGFMARWLFALCDERRAEEHFKLHPPPADRAIMSELVGWLYDYRDAHPQPGPSELSQEAVLDDGASAIVGEYMESTSHLVHGNVCEEWESAFAARANDYLLKLSLLYQISLDPPRTREVVIGVEAVARSLSVINYQMATIRHIMSQRTESPFHRKLNRLLELLRRSRGGVMTRRDVCRRLNLPIREVDELLKTAKEAGHLRDTEVAVLRDGRDPLSGEV